MKKKLDTAKIINELEESAFFRHKRQPFSQNQLLDEPVPPVRVVPPVPPGRGSTAPKRVMKQRHPFDIYQDQYRALQEIALEERKQGGVGSMSAMVREALDQLIAAKRKKK